MCSKISWQTFLLAAVFLVLLGYYYCVIGLLFYRKDIMTWLARRRSDRPATTGTLPDNELSRDTDRAGEPSALDGAGAGTHL